MVRDVVLAGVAGPFAGGDEVLSLYYLALERRAVGELAYEVNPPESRRVANRFSLQQGVHAGVHPSPGRQVERPQTPSGDRVTEASLCRPPSVFPVEHHRDAAQPCGQPFVDRLYLERADGPAKRAGFTVDLQVPDRGHAPDPRSTSALLWSSSQHASSAPSTRRTPVVLASLTALGVKRLVVMSHASSVLWWILPANSPYTDLSPTGAFHRFSWTATLRPVVSRIRSTSWMFEGGIGHTAYPKARSRPEISASNSAAPMRSNLSGTPPGLPLRTIPRNRAPRNLGTTNELLGPTSPVVVERRNPR